MYEDYPEWLPTAKIYLITNLINEKRYVGFTTFEIGKRWREHCNNGHKSILSRAIKRYGPDNFSLELLYVTPLIQYALYTLEERYIRHYNSHCKHGHGYNANYGGSHIRLGERASEETRRKQSIARSGRKNSPQCRANISRALKGRTITTEHREKLRLANLGKKASDEARAKMSAASLGRPKTPETRAKMSLYQRNRVVSDRAKENLKIAKRVHRYEIIFPSGEMEITNSLADFGKIHGVSRTGLNSVANGHYETIKGFRVRRLPKSG